MNSINAGDGQMEIGHISAVPGSAQLVPGTAGSPYGTDGSPIGVATTGGGQVNRRWVEPYCPGRFTANKLSASMNRGAINEAEFYS